ALSRLGAARLRAVLTMLGVIIGVGSVVALVAVGQGATNGITKQLQNLGTNLLTVNPGATFTGGTRGAAGSATTLKLGDAAAIAQLDGVAAVAPQVQTQALVVAGTQNTTTTVVGTTAAYATIRNYEVWQGTFLTDASLDARMRVAVLGATTADDLGLGASAIGSRITVNGLPFQVVGILQAKGSVGPISEDDQITIPLSTAQQYFVAGDSVRSIAISVASQGQIDAVKTELASTLDQRHGLSAGQTADYTIQDQSQLLGTVGNISTLLTILLAGIASISLVVGGIGIMNIMLVSVRERTREIGIRKAIGARSRDILAQFLVEALTISVIGGLIGIVVGVAASALIGAVAGWGFAFNPITVVVAVAFSLVVGVVFGVWPARQAARLDPIVALRYE
ncbi:MAG: ABC transporter permease, partial [Candidatus Limnocylindrales bacterium]